MHNRLKVVGVEHCLDASPVGQLALDKGCLGMDGFPVSKVEVVKGDDVVSLLDQFLDDDATDVAGPACYQDFHDASPCANLAFVSKGRHPVSISGSSSASVN